MNFNFLFHCRTCPHVSHLIINTSFLFSKRFLNTSSLISFFNRLLKLQLLDDGDYFLVKYAPKIVQHFPSLSHIILTVYSFDSCVQIIDMLLMGVPKLVYVKVNFHRDTLLDDPFTSDYVIQKRRQTFGFSRNNEEHVSIKNDGKALIVCLKDFSSHKE